MGDFDSKNIAAPSAGVGGLDDERIGTVLKQVADVINGANIAGPNGHAGATGATGATGPTGASRVGATGPVGPVHITQFIPPTTDPHVRGAVYNPSGGTGPGKLAISLG